MNTVREQLIYYSFISFYSSEWRTVPVLFCTPVEDLSVEVVYEEPGHAAFPLDLSHPNLERLQLTPASGSVSLDSNGFNVSARSTPVPATLTLYGWQYPPPPPLHPAQHSWKRIWRRHHQLQHRSRKRNGDRSRQV